MQKSRLTPPHVRQHFLAPVGFTEIPVRYARNFFSSAWTKILESAFSEIQYLLKFCWKNIRIYWQLLTEVSRHLYSSAACEQHKNFFINEWVFVCFLSVCGVHRVFFGYMTKLSWLSSITKQSFVLFRSSAGPRKLLCDKLSFHRYVNFSNNKFMLSENMIPPRTAHSFSSFWEKKSVFVYMTENLT